LGKGRKESRKITVQTSQTHSIAPCTHTPKLPACSERKEEKGRREERRGEVFG